MADQGIGVFVLPKYLTGNMKNGWDGLIIRLVVGDGRKYN